MMPVSTHPSCLVPGETAERWVAWDVPQALCCGLWKVCCGWVPALNRRACWEAATWGAGLWHEWELQFGVCNIRRFSSAHRPTLSLHEWYYRSWNWYFKKWGHLRGVSAVVGWILGPFFLQWYWELSAALSGTRPVVEKSSVDSRPGPCVASRAGWKRWAH